MASSRRSSGNKPKAESKLHGMFIDGLPESVRRQVSVRELAEGELLFQQGDLASAIFEVASGRVRLVRRTIDDHLVAMYTARPGDLLAEAALFSNVYHCDAVAAASLARPGVSEAGLAGGTEEKPCAVRGIRRTAGAANFRRFAPGSSCATSAQHGNGSSGICACRMPATAGRWRLRAIGKTWLRTWG